MKSESGGFTASTVSWSEGRRARVRETHDQHLAPVQPRPGPLPRHERQPQPPRHSLCHKEETALKQKVGSKTIELILKLLRKMLKDFCESFVSKLSGESLLAVVVRETVRFAD